MDEEMKSRLIGYLDAIEQSVADGSAFVAEQAPAVAWELVVYHRASSTLSVVLACVAIAVAIRLMRNFDWNREPPDEMATVMFSLLTAIFAPITILFSAPVMLKSWLAPRLLIIEELTTLLN